MCIHLQTVLLPFLITIFCIQGAKAAQKRERNADKSGKSGSKSQAKVNEAAKSIICSTCRHAFVSFVSSRCSTTDRILINYSIVDYYPCACVSDLNYLSQANFYNGCLAFSVLNNMPQINIPRRWQSASLGTMALSLRRFRGDFYVIYVVYYN